MSKKTEKYKRLGDYIRPVDVRNKDLKAERLLGVSISKEFMPSIANTIGTDMRNYKVVRDSQFVYIADTSRREGFSTSTSNLSMNPKVLLVDDPQQKWDTSHLMMKGATNLTREKSKFRQQV